MLEVSSGSLCLKRLSMNALHTSVYIYIWQLSSFRVAMLWFIDLTATTWHIQYFFLSLWGFLHEKMDKTGIYSKSAIFEWYENSRWWLLGAQSILKYWESLFKLFYEFVFELEGFGELQATKLWGQRERGIQQKCGGCTHQNLQIYLLEDAWIKLCLVMNPQKIPEKKYLLKIIMEIIFEKLTSPKYNFSILCMVHLEHPSKN